MDDDAEVAVNVAEEYDNDMKWRGAPLVSEDATGDSAWEEKHNVEEHEGSMDGPVGVAEREGKENVHIDAEDDLPASSDIDKTSAVAARGLGSISDSHEVGPELDKRAASLKRDPPSTLGTTLQAVATQALGGGKGGDGAEKEEEGVRTEQKSFTGADVEKQGYVKKVRGVIEWNVYICV